MKILLVSETYLPNTNGCAYFTQRLAQDLAKKGHKTYVISPSTKFENTFQKKAGVCEYGIRSIPLPMFQGFRISPLAKTPVKKTIQKISPDIIHLQNHFMLGKAAADYAKAANIPIVGTNHFMPENLVHYLPKKLEELFIYIGWLQFKNVYKNLLAVTTPTQTAADLLTKVGFTKEVSIISNGIDLKRFNPKNNGNYLKARYHIPSSRPILLYVGRLDREKRVEVLLRALKLILKNKKAHLILAGTGLHKKTIEKEVENLKLEKHVTFTGFVPDEDLPNLYTLADIFTIAGIAELQSIATMEALASGRPVLAADAMALPELIKNGQNGYLFPVDDHKSVAKYALKILNSTKLKKSMQKNSLEIIKKHSVNEIIESFETVYQNAIQKHQEKAKYTAANSLWYQLKLKPRTLFASFAILMGLMLYVIPAGEVDAKIDPIAKKAQERILAEIKEQQEHFPKAAEILKQIEN